MNRRSNRLAMASKVRARGSYGIGLVLLFVTTAITIAGIVNGFDFVIETLTSALSL